MLLALARGLAAILTLVGGAVAPPPLTGTVVDAAGDPVPHVVVRADGRVAHSGPDGRFTLAGVRPGPAVAHRPAWQPAGFVWDGDAAPVTVELAPQVHRAVLVPNSVASDDGRFAAALDRLAGTAATAVVFDTKDETGVIRFDTAVREAHDLGVVDVRFDADERLRQIERRGLHAITRIVVFEDPARAEADPDANLAGTWIDATDPANWEYPLDLAVEACERGFDEIQFDYVRFPAGRTAEVVRRRYDLTAEQRVATIAAFLAEAGARLRPLGCAVAADIFAIVLSAPDDQGIGQRVEDLSPHVDVLSPMIYPSHYNPGWLNLDDPNEHPAAVTADALDDAAPRIAPGVVIRPWLQAFLYTPAEVQAAIAEAEARGHGWMLWNVRGAYDREALGAPAPRRLANPPITAR